MEKFPEQDGWDPVALVRLDHECFGCGRENPIGLRLEFTADSDFVTASFIPGSAHQGFGGIVHGGIISAVLDEAMAWATAHAGFWAMSGDIRVRFRRPLSVAEPALVTERVSGVSGRIVTTVNSLVLASNQSPVATATATFVKVSAELEAAWRARYLRESPTIAAEPGQAPGATAEQRVQSDEPHLSSAGAPAPRARI